MEHRFETLRWRTRTLALSAAVLAGAVACASSEPAPQPRSQTCPADADCDGIKDFQDQAPYFKDVDDVDFDGIRNKDDLFPYDTNNGAPVTTPTTRSTDTSYVDRPCVYGGTPDSDGDKIPDYCDLVYNEGNKYREE